jgi:hypothetical protein
MVNPPGKSERNLIAIQVFAIVIAFPAFVV